MSVVDRYIRTLPISGERIPLLTILLIGSALRFFGISAGYGDPSHRNDEPFTQHLTTQTLPEIVQLTAGDVHPPLYYFIARGWALVFGSSFTSLRALSAVFGVAAIYLTFLAGREFFNGKIGLYAALFISLNWFQVFKSQDARMYTMLITVSLIGMYGLARILENPRDRVGLVALILGNAFAMYTHAYAVFFLIAQLLFITLELGIHNITPQAVLSWVAAQVVVVLLYIPWVPSLLNQTGTEDVDSVSAPVAVLIHTFIGWYSGTALLAILFATMFIAAGLRYLHYPEIRQPTRFLVLVGLLSVVVPLLLAMVIPPIRYASRYTMVATPAFYILAASGLTYLQSSRIEKGVIVLFIIFSIERLGMYYEWWSQLI